jgi:hypothetical protein
VLRSHHRLRSDGTIPMSATTVAALASGDAPLLRYPAGSWRPAAADRFLAASDGWTKHN